MIPRPKRNSSNVNLIISAVFHTVLVLGVAYFAARNGVFGKKMKALTAVVEQKEKKPEQPKEKPPERRPEPPKEQEAKAAAPKMQVASTAPPPDAPAAVAPAAVDVPAIDYSEGPAVQTTSDPNAIYKSLVEHALRSRWNRPDGLPDDNYQVQVQLSVDSKGRISDYQWIKGSGDAQWDASVKTALAQTKTISRPPPKGFPSSFTVRFDVDSEPIDGSSPSQFSSR